MKTAPLASDVKRLDANIQISKFPVIIMRASTDGIGWRVYTVGVATAENLEVRRCPVPSCNIQITDPNSAVNHSAYHMIHTPQQLTVESPCLLCYGGSADCPVYLEKTGSQILQPRIFCKVYNPGASPNQPETCVKFTGKSMLESSQSLPSSNTPIICPVCNPKCAMQCHLIPGSSRGSKKQQKWRPAVMKYNFHHHWT